MFVLTVVVPVAGAGPLVSVDDGVSRYSLLDGAVGELGSELSSGDGELAPTFDGGLRVDWAGAEPARSDAGFARPGQMQSVTTAGVAGDWTVIVFAEGTIRFRLVGRPEAEIVSVDRAGNAVVFEDESGGLGEHVIVVGDGVIEEFVHVAAHDGIGYSTMSWEVELPAGWRLDVGPDRIYVLDGELTPVMQVLAPSAQDSTGQILPQVLSADEDSISVAVDESSAVGAYLVDPSWHQTSSYPEFSRKYCADGSAGSCDVTSSGQPDGWAESGNTVKYNSNHTPGYGPYIGARATAVDAGYWERYTYNPPSGLRMKGVAMYMHINSPTGTFQCRSAAYNGVETAWEYGNWKSHSSSQVYFSIWPGGDWFTQQGFTMENTSGSTFTPGTADGNRCYHKESADDITTHLLSDTVDPSVSAAGGSWTGDVDWYKSGDEILVTKTADDDGSGIESFDLQIDGPEPGSYTKTGIQTCTPASNASRPCLLSNDSPHTLTLNDTVAQQGMPNKMRWIVYDYAGRDKTGSYSSTGFGYDSKKPLPPAWVADGAAADIDGIDSSTTVVANWAKARERGPSGLERYEYCISTEVEVSDGAGVDCDGTIVVGYTDVGLSTSIAKSGLSLTTGVDYFVCVRSRDQAGNYSSVSICSDGAAADLSPPSAPVAVYDGVDVGHDWDATSDDSELQANWEGGSDGSGSGVHSFEYCFTSTTVASCDSDEPVKWTPSASLEGEAEVALLASTTYKVCVRTVDQAMLRSGAVCSDGLEVDTDEPSAPAAVSDGPGGDLDVMAADPDLDFNWTAGSDTTTSVDEYYICLAYAGSVDPCYEPSPVIEWTAVDATSTTLDGAGLPEGQELIACVTASDLAGNESALECSDGFSVVGVTDGIQAEDTDWSASLTTAKVSWSAAAEEGTSATHTDVCLTETTDGSDCATTAVEPWQSTGSSTETTFSGQSLSDHTVYRSCVRYSSSDVLCSDGFETDATAPSAPAEVYDGSDTTDDETSFDTTTLQSTWEQSTDADSGLSHYETCAVPVGVACIAEDWGESDAQPTTVITDDWMLDSSYRVCVRAIDTAGNASAETCSDGQDIEPSAEELAEVSGARETFGLPTDATTLDNLMHDTSTTMESGVMVTPSEQAEVAETVANMDDATDAVDTYGLDHPDTYAGLDVSYEDGGTVTAKFTDTDTTTEETALEQLVPADVDLEVEGGAEHSEKDLQETADALLDDAENLDGRGIEVTATEVDVDTGAVVVSTREGDQAEPENETTSAVLEESEEYNAPIIVDEEQSAAAAGWADKATFRLRRGKLSPGTGYVHRYHYKSTDIFGSQCSSNAHVRKNGQWYMVTAYHCTRPSHTRSDGYFAGAERHGGLILPRPIAGKKQFFKADKKVSYVGKLHEAAAIPITNGVTSSEVFRKWKRPTRTDLTRPITGFWPALDGAEGVKPIKLGRRVCISGVNRSLWRAGNRQGEVCGIVKGRLKKRRVVHSVRDPTVPGAAYDSLWDFYAKVVKVKMDKGGKVCNGDSGGIVYARSNGDALVAGIVSMSNAGFDLVDSKTNDEDDDWHTDGVISKTYGQLKSNPWGAAIRCGDLMWFGSFPKYYQQKGFDALRSQ